MGLSDEAKIAQQAGDLAKKHPQQVEEAVTNAEKFAQDRTDHRHDQQIAEGGEELDKRLGAGQPDQQVQQAQQGQPDQQGQQPSGENGNNAGSGA